MKPNLPQKIQMDATGISFSPYQVVQDARNFLTGELEWEITAMMWGRVLFRCPIQILLPFGELIFLLADE